MSCSDKVALENQRGVTSERRKTYVPLLGISTNEEENPRLVHLKLKQAVSRGVKIIDTNYSDKCERKVKKVLRRRWKRGDARSKYFVIAKLPMIGNRGADVSKFLHKSLKRLGLDYVDAYFIEGPVGLSGKDDNDVRPRNQEGQPQLDMDTCLRDVWRAMEKEHSKGYCKMLGLCNCNMAQLSRIYDMARVPPAIMQLDINAYNMCVEEREFMRSLQVTPFAIHPLGNPLHVPTEEYPWLVEHKTVRSVAEKHGVTPASILLKFLHQQEIVSITQTNAVNDVGQLFESLDDFNLRHEDMLKLTRLDQGGEGRLRNFVELDGCQLHPEYPFTYNYMRGCLLGTRQ
ncbi:hypothetical protein Pcinc_040116 [Petrolisthes cinctipes]|uniref:NADP-dependent oxidoreductase domain-containing protein n=1 Tax=Petrolisthes cinctipes TaxID=88211 RepID=A0AAE1EIE9_PETCI|nr:hypothetical protein Pcinc_040116 [Petrolisthes cinctipes]